MPSPRNTLSPDAARLPPANCTPAGHVTLVDTSNAPPPPVFSSAVASRSVSPASMPLTSPLTALMSVMAPANGTPALPGGFHVPVVPVIVPSLLATTPCRIASVGSATDTITATSEEISGWWTIVVTWLDCASTSSERWSAYGWSPTRRVNCTWIVLPPSALVAKLPKLKTSELPVPSATLTSAPGFVLPGPNDHWPTPVP